MFHSIDERVWLLQNALIKKIISKVIHLFLFLFFDHCIASYFDNIGNVKHFYYNISFI